MPKYEKLSAAGLTIVCSFVVSFAVSFLVYRFFVPSVREAELKLGSILPDGVIEITRGKKEVAENYSIRVENQGKLSLSNVVVTMKATGLAKVAKTPAATITLDPPLPHNEQTTSEDKDTLYVRLDAPLAPTDHVTVTLILHHPVAFKRSARHPKSENISNNLSAWVSSDGTATTSVPWRGRGIFSFTVRVRD